MSDKILLQPEPVVVMCHYDLDAAGSSILLDHAYNVVGRRHMGYPKLRESMESLRAEYPTINTLVTADLSIEPDDLQWAIEHWDRVIYYDHHLNSAQYAPLAEAIPDRFRHVFSLDMSATALIYKDYIEVGNAMTGELNDLVEIVNTYDMWYKDNPSFTDGEIMNGIFWDLHMDTFRARFKDGFTGFTEMELKQHEARTKAEKEIVDKALIEKLDSGSQIVMIEDQSAINAVSKNMDGDIFYIMYFNERAKETDNALQMSVRCKDDMPEINLNMAVEELLETGDYDDILKSGGGHANAIGVLFQRGVEPNVAADFIMEHLDKRVRHW